VKRTFVYTRLYEREARTIGISEIVERQFEHEVVAFPEKGDVIQGTGGIRKIRVGDRQRKMGKRGGYRFFYVDFPEVHKTYVLWVLSKRESEDISADEKAILRQLISELKKELKA
jgi:hypothetical protein